MNKNITPAKGINIKRSITMAAAAMVALILGITACSHDNKTASAQQAVVNDSNAAANDTMRAQYNTIKMQVDQITTSNMRLDSQLAQKGIEVARLTAEVSKLKHSNR